MAFCHPQQLRVFRISMLSLVTAVLILSATFDSAEVLASVLGLKV